MKHYPENMTGFARRTLLLLITAMLLFSCCPGVLAEEKTGFYDQFPPLLRVTQQEFAEEPHKNVSVRRTYPTTANETVNAEMRALIDSMHAKAADLPPKKSVNDLTDLDTGAVIWRTGTKWMSFLTMTRYTDYRDVAYLDEDSRVYDMETGSRVWLTDLFPADSPAWETVAAAVREQLNAYFPGERAEETAVEALCTRETLESAGFCLTPCRLMLNYRADALYPGHNTLMHVYLWLDELRPFMTETAREQTDNSRYKKIALTYDDGPAAGYTKRLLNSLREGAATATFFIVGERMASNHYNICREQDAGCSCQSHNYYHEYANKNTISHLEDWKARFAKEMSELIGVVPSLIRAPGGKEDAYINHQYGMPLIHWSLISNDVSEKEKDRQTAAVTRHVTGNLKNGAVVLMHDLRPNCSEYTKGILEYTNEHGYLCVTVEELFHDAGIPLLPDTVYWSPDRSK